jgi:hypothetical protein
LELSNSSSSWDNGRDHVHALYIYHTIILPKINGLAYLLLYTVQTMDTRSYDDLMSYTLYTRHLPSFLYLYSNLIEMLISSNPIATLTKLDMYAYNNFPLTTRLLAWPQPGFEISAASKDISSVETNN